MVQKRSKFSLNSGCTFKFGRHFSEAKFLSAQQGVIHKTYHKRFIQQANFQELNKRILESCNQLVEEDQFIVQYPIGRQNGWGPGPVLYSLNKRKRWLFPELISEGIDELHELELEQPAEKDKKFKLTLVERKLDALDGTLYPRFNQADVAAYHDSSLHDPHVYPHNQQGYSYQTDLLEKGKNLSKNLEVKKKRKRNHNQKFRHDCQRPFLKRFQAEEAQRANMLEENKEKVPEIQYEICAPKQSLTAHPKFGDSSYVRYWLFNGHKKSSKKVKSQRNKKWVMHETGYTSKEFSRLHKLARNEMVQLEEDFQEMSEAIAENAGEDIMTVTDHGNVMTSAVHEDIMGNGNIREEEYVMVDEDVMVMENEEDVMDIVDREGVCEFTRKPLTVSLYDALYLAPHTTSNMRKSSVKHKTPQSSTRQTARKGKGEAISIDDLEFWQDFPVEKVAARQNEATETDDAPTPETTRTEVSPTYITHKKSDFKFVPVVTLVTEGSIHPKTLEGLYKENYMEGHSHPRCFVVKLESSRVSPLQENFIVFHVHGHDNDDNWVVGDDDSLILAGNEMCEKEKQAVKLSVTLRCHIPQEQLSAIRHELIAQLSDSSVHTLEHLVKCVHHCLAANCPTVKEEKEVISSNSHSSPQPGLFKNLALFNSWAVDCFTKENAFTALQDERLHIHQNKMKKLHSLSAVVTNCPGSDDLVCDICFDPVRENGHVMGSAMKSCDHWFCDTCWYCHLVERISQGDLMLSCPGYECDTVVDTASLLTLLPHSYYLKHQSHLGDAKLESSTQWTWCKEATCGKAIRARTTTKQNSSAQQRFPGWSNGSVDNGMQNSPRRDIEEGICVSCVCRSSWCFDCQEEPHWPASCELADMYVKQVIQRGDDSERGVKGSVYFAAVKRCPECRHPMEKNGGCQHMTCRCGHHFCWECLQHWHHHDWDTCLKVTKKEENIELDSSVGIRTYRESYYKMAVKHRKIRKRLRKKRAITGDVDVFLYECHFLLEWSYAVLSSCTYRQIQKTGVKGQLTTLNFLLDIKHEKLCSLEIDTWLKMAKSVFCHICARMRRLQRILCEVEAKKKMQ